SLSAALAAASAPAPPGRWLAFLIDDDLGLVGPGAVVFLLVLVFAVVVDVAALDRRDIVLLARVDLLDMRQVIVAVVGFELVVLLVGAQRGLFLGVGALLGEQRLAVGLRNLIVVGMDLAEGEEAVPVAAE